MGKMPSGSLLLKYLMWFIQEDLLGMHGNVWAGIFLKDVDSKSGASLKQ